MKLTDREQKIETLLAWWTDVLEGWQEGGRGQDEFGIKMMGRAWNHPSYRELHRCLVALRDEENRTYWHVRERYQAARRTVLVCPKCDAIENVAARHFKYTEDGRHVTLKHKHGDPVFFVLKSVPSVNAAVREDVVEDGVRWIAARFQGEPFIPDELLAKEKAA
jgi:hypothetical protein